MPIPGTDIPGCGDLPCAADASMGGKIVAKLSKHAEWLSLIEVSGPFISIEMLDQIFPQGLEAIYPESKRRIRSAYYEWCEAVDDADASLPALHQAWCKLVLVEFLEFPVDLMLAGDSFKVTGDDGNGLFSPDWILQGNDGKPMLFIKTLPPETNLAVAERRDDWSASLLDKMTKLCRVNDVRLGLLTNGEQWMLVNAPNGSTSSNISWYARLWFQEPKTLQAFSSLLGVRRFFGPANETLPALLEESLSHLEEVTNTLGEQVRIAVEVLIQGLDNADEDRNRELLRDVSPSELYEAGLTVMMRLVFILCAEERGLLLLGDETYDQYYAVSTLRGQLAEEADKYGAEILERRHDAWVRLLSVFRAVYGGIEHPTLRLPPLGGSIFDPDKFPFLEGRAKGTSYKDSNPTPLPIDNRTVLLLLTSLQILEQPGGAILLSYRALDVEQIGHIYEGLLEHTAIKVAGTTLGLSGSSKAKNPNIGLAELESLSLDSEKDLFDRVKTITLRSPAAIRNGYEKKPSQELVDKLAAVCAGDQALIERIKPFANWLRNDAWDQPLVYHQGAFMVTMGQDRRDSGTHYTPKILTEKIVETTLEPVVYIGPAEGKPRKEWTLKTPAELLNLKICDPAMGSGAFLVQACRYLAERLTEAWAKAEANGKFIAISGEVCDLPDSEPMTNIPDERINEARRLIAERCLYGVDINPLAVELAKLSIWLVTISKGRPFGYLDHNLKSGDSLLGIHDIDQLRELRMKPTGKGSNFLFGRGIGDAVDEAIKLRQEIRNTAVRDITDVQLMAEFNDEAQQQLEKVDLLADLFITEVFSFTGSAKKLQSRLDALSTVVDEVLSGDKETHKHYHYKVRKKIDVDLPTGKKPRHHFHWVLEFPEVFQDSGFDAICGNPPFSGGQHLTGTLGTAYRNYLVNHIADGTRGSADLVAYFYLNAYNLLKDGGVFGLIACNTIAEGDTRQVGLERLLKQTATIIAANPNMPWPGTAAVVISPVFVAKNIEWRGKYLLNDREVDTISAFLSAQEEWSPKVLKANANQSFQGSIVLGMGFTMSEAEAKAFIERNPKNAEVLFPYLNGNDLNSDPEQKPSRWVINFWDWPLDREAEGSWENATERQKKDYLSSGRVPMDYPNRVAADFPELLNIVREKVKPERDKLNDSNSTGRKRKNFWWCYGGDSKGLYHAIGRGASFVKHPDNWTSNTDQNRKVLAITRVSKTLAFAYIPNNTVFADAVVCFSVIGFAFFGIIQSNVHVGYAWQQASRMKNDLRYSPSDAFETFPFPQCNTEQSNTLELFSREFYFLREQIMKKHGIGLTKFYHLFNTPENQESKIAEARRLQKQIDEIVCDSYGWDDINLKHDFHNVGYLPENDNIRYTISEPARIEILRRLAILNKQRWQEEQSGKA